MEDLKAKKAFKYAGRPLSAGDTFKAPPSHAKVLVAMGNAEAYVAPVVQAQPPAAAKAPRSPARKATNSGRRSGGYQRRDMTAVVAVVADAAPVEGVEDGTGDSADADGGAE